MFADKEKMGSDHPHLFRSKQPWILRIKLRKTDSPEYGGLVIRELSIRDEAVPKMLMEWPLLLGPILPTEAWAVAERTQMALQGIVLRGEGTRIRVYRELSGRITTTRETHDPETNALVNHEFISSSDPGDALAVISELTALNQIYPVPTSSLGWDVADIWRTDEPVFEEQARLLDLAPYQLETRLRRRREASERKLP